MESHSTVTSATLMERARARVRIDRVRARTEQRLRTANQFAERVADVARQIGDMLKGSDVPAVAEAHELAGRLADDSERFAGIWREGLPPFPKDDARPVRLDEILRSLVQRYAPFFRNEGIRLEAPDPIPEVTAWGWPTLLETAVRHLLGAAMAATRLAPESEEKRSVRIGLEVGKPPGFVTVVVEDRGAAIPENDRALALDPGQIEVAPIGSGADSPDKEERALGLWTARLIVEEIHQGEMRIVRPQDEWTNRYEIRLPADEGTLAGPTG